MIKPYGEYFIDEDKQLLLFNIDEFLIKTNRDLLIEMGHDDARFLYPYSDNDNAIYGISTSGCIVYNSTKISDDAISDTEGEYNPISFEPCSFDALDDDIIVLDPHGLNDAIIGVTDDNRAVYDYDKLIESFMRENNWTSEEAEDWVSYNTIRSLPYIPLSPILVFNLEQYL